MVIAMLDRRRDFMIDLSRDLTNRVDIVDINAYREFMDL